MRIIDLLEKKLWWLYILYKANYIIECLGINGSQSYFFVLKDASSTKNLEFCNFAALSIIPRL